MIMLKPILTAWLIHFSLKGWENVLFELGSESRSDIPRRGRRICYDCRVTPRQYCFQEKQKSIIFILLRSSTSSCAGSRSLLNAECKVCALALSTMIISAGNILAEAQGKIMRLLKSSNETWPRIIYSLDWSGNNNSLFWGWFSLLLNIRKVFRNLAYLSSAETSGLYCAIIECEINWGTL